MAFFLLCGNFISELASIPMIPLSMFYLGLCVTTLRDGTGLVQPLDWIGLVWIGLDWICMLGKTGSYFGRLVFSCLFALSKKCT